MAFGSRKSFGMCLAIFAMCSVVFAQDVVLPKIEGTDAPTMPFTIQSNYVQIDNPNIMSDKHIREEMFLYNERIGEELRNGWDKQKEYENKNQYIGIILKIAKNGKIINFSISDNSSKEIKSDVTEYMKSISKVASLPKEYGGGIYTVYITLGKEPVHSTNRDIHQNVDFSDYVINLQNTIKSKWKPPVGRGMVSRNLVVTLQIQKDGTLSKCEIETSSGNNEFDESGIKAINSVGKFKPLPAKFKGSNITLLFTFDMTVYRGNSIYSDSNIDKNPINPTEMYQALTNDLSIIKPDLIIKREDYMYLKTQKGSDYRHYKVDCKNNKIGSETTNNPYSRVLYGNVMMHNPLGIDKKVFDYACGVR